MDIPRVPPNRKARRVWYGAAAAGLVVLATLGLKGLKPAAPHVDLATIWVDSVQRGPLVLQVRGPGTLVPERVRWISAVTAGRVERRLAEIGQEVKPETVLLVLSNPDVQLEVTAGRFREDLLFRLNTIEIHLPPLRQRRDEIPALAHHFLRRYAAKYRKPLVNFESEALSALEAHLWPGNVRELDHTIERAALLASGTHIRVADLGLRSAGASATLDDMPLDEVEKVLIRKALDRHGGNVSQAAKALGLSRSALYRRLQQHGF